MKVNKLKLDKDETSLTFTLVDRTPGESAQPRKIICLCEDLAKYNNWITALQNLLDMQNKFLIGKRSHLTIRQIYIYIERSIIKSII